MVAIYGASKLKHAEMWLDLRIEFPWIDWTARWPDIVGKWEDTSDNAQCFWQVDFEDVAKADYVFCYGQLTDHLRGALVEAGIALGLGRWVIVIGQSPDFGTWQYHPHVLRCNDMAEAIRMAEYMGSRK